MGHPDVFSVPVTDTFYRTGIVDAIPGFMEAIISHELSTRTDRDAILIDPIRIASGCGICARPGIQSNDRSDIIFHDIFIDTNGVMTTVIDSVVNPPVQTMFPDGFLQSIQTLHGEGEIGLRCLGDGYLHWQVMTVGGDNMLVVIMTEVVTLSVGVISPVSSGIRIESAALAVIYAIFTALA